LANENTKARKFFTLIKTKHLQFSFLPYISIPHEIKIGNILLWSFYKNKNKYIKNVGVKNHIEKILRQYLTNGRNRKPLKNIAIVSYGSPDNFLPYSIRSKQYQEKKDVVTILCFTTIIMNNPIMAKSYSDFLLIHQNFLPGDNFIAPMSGSYIRRNCGGLKIKDGIFITPFHISNDFDVNYDIRNSGSIRKS